MLLAFSNVFIIQVQLRKSLAEARFKARSERFFQRWKEVFEKDLGLEDWFLREKDEDNNEDYQL